MGKLVTITHKNANRARVISAQALERYEAKGWKAEGKPVDAPADEPTPAPDVASAAQTPKRTGSGRS